jgi:trehalose 6-phosphate phosphatase
VDALQSLADDPTRTAILLDVDGVLAPIVSDPADSRVPPTTRSELRRLSRRYGLVACISGRSEDDARRVVGVPELVYAGNHGLELSDEAGAWRPAIEQILDGANWPDAEDKGVSASFHYRRAPDECEARAALEALAERARARGLVTRFGRKVLEVLPPVDANKGTAVRFLLAERGLTRALFAGDDTTDLDAFAAVRSVELGVCVAVASAEGPAELRERADLVVATPAEFREQVLQQL